MDLYERGLHAGLVGNAEAEGAAQEGRSASGGKEEDESAAWSYHDTILSRKLWQDVCQATDREGGGCHLPDDQCTKTGRPVAEVLQEKQPDMRVPPMENPMCAAFEEDKEATKMVTLDFTEDDVTWVTSKLSGAAGALGADVIELRNCLLIFGCASKEFRVVVASLAD